jgi:hypothetical protein
MLHTLWAIAIRDQVLKRNRLPTRGNYVTYQEQDAKKIYAFYNAGIRSQFGIMYISYNNFHIYLAGTRSGPCRWVRYAPERYLTWPSLHRHRPLGVLAATRPTARLGGWRHQPCGISTLIRPIPTLLSVPSVACVAPMLGGWARQGTQHTFGGSSNSHARGLGATRHSVYLRWLVWLPYSGLGTGNNLASHNAEVGEIF